MKIVGRKNHPNSSEDEVVVFETKVRHEIAVPIKTDEKEVKEIIKRYLKGYDIDDFIEGKKVHVKGYENIYPETADTKD
ncbi:hypothetical protein [Thermofilum sp.]|uniref:hypothetical protein n=1 Tax=Thermofilum sp. TaxID=1961369 RepID=UPI00317F79DE